MKESIAHDIVFLIQDDDNQLDGNSICYQLANLYFYKRKDTYEMMRKYGKSARKKLGKGGAL